MRWWPIKLFCFLSSRWVKFGMNWSQSWTASLWDPTTCQHHRCHPRRATSFPIKCFDIRHWPSRTAVKRGVLWPLSPVIKMNPPNSYFYTAALSCSLTYGQTGNRAAHTERQSLNFCSLFWSAMGHDWDSLPPWPSCLRTGSGLGHQVSQFSCCWSPMLLMLTAHNKLFTRIYLHTYRPRSKVQRRTECLKHSLLFKLGA